jgi:L-aminopeptidase/D-esterase-like protein
VTVGHTTLIAGEGPLRVGEGPVRTGVTAVLPRGAASLEEPVFAGWFALNGNGEMTGTPWIEESGQLAGPIMLTNTNSVGVVRDAVLQWWVDRAPDPRMEVEWSLPVVAETHDGYLNDINGFHVKPQHVFRALETASGGTVPEGNVGGGTGMVCFGFKGGIGTSSRLVLAAGRRHAVGVLVQTNFGRRHQLRIAGVSVGRDLREAIPYASLDPRVEVGGAGSIVAVVATDAPLLPHQLKRLARRVALGVARTGGIAMNGSGDLFVAFSTASRGLGSSAEPVQLSMLPNELLDPLFAATVQATEESIVNALVAADDMTGVDNHSVMALPHDRVRQLLRARGLLPEQGP